jgi:hypothetical protein
MNVLLLHFSRNILGQAKDTVQLEYRRNAEKGEIMCQRRSTEITGTRSSNYWVQKRKQLEKGYGYSCPN